MGSDVTSNFCRSRCWKLRLTPFALAVFLFTGCAVFKPTASSIEHQSIHIAWDASTLRLIQPGGCYGRIIRLADGDLLCGFELESKAAVRRSSDEGRTWGEPVMAAAWAHGVVANPDLLQLRDGSILLFYNERPSPPPPNTPESELQPFAIGVVASRDGGRTWGEPVRLYSASPDFHDGCWEPAAIQLPSGEVHLYFANESPYRQSVEQDITLMRSHDGGRTWGAPETAIFRAGHRDGMPSPIVLADGSGIAVAIEDNGYMGTLKPVITFMPMGENWRSGPVGGDSERRWGALAEPHPPEHYAGAPSLRQMPGGTTVLSYQHSEDGTFHKARMIVCVGDAQARDFGNPTYPFPYVPGVAQLWNSLFVKNDNTIMALSTTTIGGTWGLWSIEGKLLSEQ